MVTKRPLKGHKIYTLAYPILHVLEGAEAESWLFMVLVEYKKVITEEDRFTSDHLIVLLTMNLVTLRRLRTSKLVLN